MTCCTSPLRALLFLFIFPAFVIPLHAADAAPADCQYHQLATLPLRYTGPGLSLTIEGRIDGTPADMLVDTGATSSMLTRTATARRGLSLSPSNERMRGIGGYSRVYTTRIREFQAGPAGIRNSRVRVIGDMGFEPSFDAILGAHFLLQTDFEIVLASKEVRFFKPSNCKKAMLAYWDPDAVEIPFDTGFSRHPSPYFKVLLNGKEIIAMIDSGAATSVVTRKAVERAGLSLDALGAQQIPSAAGIGSGRVARWGAVLPLLQIGRETIHNADLGVIETEDLDVDLLLGADFLRAHRVLFAMSQRKLYISYVGGAPFGQRRTLEPWLQQEADAGNGDAQLALASIHARGLGVPRDAAAARSWIDRAAAGGNPRAMLQLGQHLQREEKHADAIVHLRAALARMPTERFGALWLYAARMRSGDAELARRELEATFARDDEDDWPRPIAEFYLGKLDEPRLLALARKDRSSARARACQAGFHIAEHHRLAGAPERAAQALRDIPECRVTPPKPAQDADT